MSLIQTAVHRLSSDASPPSRVSLVVVLVSSLSASWSVYGQQNFDVALRDGLLSIRANNTPMKDLAEALAEETGVRFVVTGNASEAVTAEIVDLPLLTAVAKLSPNHLLVKDSKRDDAKVIEVVMMLDDPDSGGSDDAFLPSGAPADEIVSGDEALGIPEDPANAVPNQIQQIGTEAVQTGQALDPQSSAPGSGQADAVQGDINAPNVLPLK